MSEFLGVPLGVLIGLITGLVLLLVLQAANVQHPVLKDTLTVAGQLLAIPTFWFGGPWIATAAITALQSESNALWPWYLVTLSILFFAIAVYPLVVLIVRVAHQLGTLDAARK